MNIKGLIFLFLWLSTNSDIGSSFGEYKKNVLIIHSYHQNFEWTDELTRGLFDELNPNENEYFTQIEYLDFKRYQNTEIFEPIYELMRKKFKNTKFDIVIATDDGALKFLQKFNKDYFNTIPKVFCGINNYSDKMIEGMDNISGVKESNDIRSTLDLIRKNHPQKKNLVVITDSTLTTREVMKIFNSEINSGNYKFNLKILNSNSQELLLKTFNSNESDNMVGLVIGYFLDEKGNFDSYKIRLKKLSEKINVPLYGVWNILIGHGIVGGKLTDSYDQGRAAGNLASQILNGTNVNDIPIVIKVPNHYKFDYKYLTKFNISEDTLPNNSKIINKPTNNFNLSYETVVGLALLFTLLIFSVLLLIAYSLHKRKTEKNLLRAKQQAENANRLKTEFLAQMSHEIRTPVNTILSFSALIKSSLVSSIDKDLENCFSSIENGGRRLIRTIDLIIKMAEVQSGSIEIKKKEVSFYKNILAPVVDEFRVLASDKNLKLELNNNSIQECILEVDAHTMRQIIANLIDNAIKYTFRGGITVDYSNQGRECKIEIVDTGVGISEEYLGRIFEPFTQEEQGYSRKFEGNGLGLALVKKYCEINDVDISIDSKKGEGTKITLLITKE